jgi:hypothetical protein
MNLLQPTSSFKSLDLDPNTKIAILNSLSIALNLKDLVCELSPLLMNSKLMDFITNKSGEHLSSSVEAIQIL